MGNVNGKESRSRSSSRSEGQQYYRQGRDRANTTPSFPSGLRHSNNSNSGSHLPRSSKKSGKKKQGEETERLVPDASDMVDGGYLAPHGVYSAPHTFKYKIVRQLMIERKLAPFYKGLSDFESHWSDRQLLAAVRGIPVSDVKREEVNEDDEAEEEEEEEDDDDEETNESGPALAKTMSEPQKYDNICESASVSIQDATDELSKARIDETRPSEESKEKSDLLSPDSTSSHKQSHSPMTPSSTSGSEEVEDAEMTRIYQMKADAEGVTETEHVESTTDSQSSQDGQQQQQQQPVSSESTEAKRKPATRNRSYTASRYVTSSQPQQGTPLEVLLYRGAVECPICFLFYPKYINSTRCCLQPICSECFVEIKRSDPHPPHHVHEESSSSDRTPDTTEQSSSSSAEAQHQLVTEPACCPYCTAPDFGVVYYPPPMRAGVGANTSSKHLALNLLTNTPSDKSQDRPVGPAHDRRKGSLPPSAAEVVTIDQIRPDWVQTLHAARQHAARRSAAANALHATAFLSSDDPRSSSSSNSSRRHRFRGLSGGGGGAGGVNSRRRDNAQGIEDMMLVEAIRLSMYDEEVRKKKEASDKKKKNKKAGDGDGDGAGDEDSDSTSNNATTATAEPVASSAGEGTSSTV